jgi:hypothetical protein
MIFEKIKAVWNWRYDSEHDLASIYYFWQTFVCWWAERPRLVECAHCESKIWRWGNPSETYCNQYCAFYGSNQIEIEEEGIPF